MALPSLVSLRAFEASARLGSFSRAAEEMHVTQAAISQQIRTLEGIVGGDLFRREHRRVVLTELGRLYLGLISHSLETMESAHNSVRAVARRDALFVKVAITFANKWLLPRLPHFAAAHPGVAVSVLTYDYFDPLDVSAADFIITSGRGPWPGLREEQLNSTRLLAVASPRLLRRVGAIDMARLSAYPIIHTLARRDDWRVWCRARGIMAPPIDRGYIFESSTLSYTAALNGLGLVIAEDLLIRDEIADGTLVQIDALECSIDRAYYLLEPENRQRKEASLVFRDWILEQAGRSHHF